METYCELKTPYCDSLRADIWLKKNKEYYYIYDNTEIIDGMIVVDGEEVVEASRIPDVDECCFDFHYQTDADGYRGELLLVVVVNKKDFLLSLMLFLAKYGERIITLQNVIDSEVMPHLSNVTTLLQNAQVDIDHRLHYMFTFPVDIRVVENNIIKNSGTLSVVNLTFV